MGLTITDTMTPLDRCPALILNADYRPLSYFPLSVWPWQEAVKVIFRESVTVIVKPIGPCSLSG